MYGAVLLKMNSRKCLFNAAFARASVVLIFLLFPTISYAEKKVDVLPIWGIDVYINFKVENLDQNKQRLLSLIDSAFVHYSRLFGGPPKKLNGESYDRLTVNVHNTLTYEADPEIIDVGIHNKKLFGFYTWELGVIHEMLHLWSGETFKYADNREQWFNEGASDYLTLRLGAALGIIPEDRILSTFAAPISTYLSAKGIGTISLREAGSTDQLKRDHYFIVYHGGYVAALVLDHQIRLKSKGQASLDDLMHKLYQSNSRTKPYTMESLLTSLHESTSVDFTAFFEKHIDGSEIIPIGSYFDIGMLELFNQYGVEVTDENQRVLKKMLMFTLE